MAKEHVTFRFSPGIKQRLADAAKKEHRPVSNLAEWIVLQWLDQHHPEQPSNTQDNNDED